MKERLDYTYGTIWLRDETSGTLRLAAGDGPNGPLRAHRPSPLAMQAFQSGERAGIYARVSREVVRAGPDERRRNPRSKPAKLRWALRADH